MITTNTFYTQFLRKVKELNVGQEKEKLFEDQIKKAIDESNTWF